MLGSRILWGLHGVLISCSRGLHWRDEEEVRQGDPSSSLCPLESLVCLDLGPAGLLWGQDVP